MNNSPYLDRPLLPLAVALPPMLEKIEAELGTAGPAETRRLSLRVPVERDHGFRWKMITQSGGT
jgi:hypothetical protein